MHLRMLEQLQVVSACQGRSTLATKGLVLIHVPVFSAVLAIGRPLTLSEMPSCGHGRACCCLHTPDVQHLWQVDERATLSTTWHPRNITCRAT